MELLKIDIDKTKAMLILNKDQAKFFRVNDFIIIVTS